MIDMYQSASYGHSEGISFHRKSIRLRPLAPSRAESSCHDWSGRPHLAFFQPPVVATGHARFQVWCSSSPRSTIHTSLCLLSGVPLVGKVSRKGLGISLSRSGRSEGCVRCDLKSVKWKKATLFPKVEVGPDPGWWNTGQSWNRAEESLWRFWLRPDLFKRLNNLELLAKSYWTVNWYHSSQPTTMTAVSEVEPPLFAARTFLDQFFDFLLSNLHTFSYAYPIHHPCSFFLFPFPLLASELALWPFLSHLQPVPALLEAERPPFSVTLLSI